ncbi:family 20 glycosylhydrolase [Zobellia galactanivorans]|uniref:Glycoside hydrolase, family GH20 n=1 Tax=Zobellia galactanivorans (strain DSM 12802 / CCUG 47099 / CIP 106680 / NCIMB 13871 / Dsij) TaxID=63186 RepID=G0L0K9_ZOBGA|nr:family 20 glycosylhydrolase [Zobellia galactanivorans]CAZ97487.1 Glycoside hydrolase, family GH20 [Zobellia galactanivorans]
MRSKHILYSIAVWLVLLVMPLHFQAQTSGNKRTDDFAVKGFHIDLRIQVMTPQALKDFATELSGFGINTLVMEWEGTYPFKNHATISNKYSYTREEIKDFVAHCDSLGIQVVPLQQSLGHVEYILRNPRYSILKEDRKDISQLCPMQVEANIELFSDLLADLSETHNSDYIHLGGDETYLLGHCSLCKKKVEEEGKSKLFVDHMKMVAEAVIALGKKPIIWADIILKYPEAAAELPEETIFIDWNYGWKTNHFGDVAGLQELGFTFWGSPAIRSHPDNWYGTGWMTHFKNQRDFIPYAREANYKGLFMTSWSTSGVYGFTWDVGYDVMDMVQMRNTYPMAGFRILIASYAHALKTDEPLDIEAFVRDYGKKRFGLNRADSQKLWDFFSANPEPITNGKASKSGSIEEVKERYGKIREAISSVTPSKNIREFGHFKLMADLRMHYLDFKNIEARYNSKGFSVADTPELLKALDQVLKDAKDLDKRFIDLNKGFLYDAELQEQNALRVEPVKGLYDRLAKLK